MITTEAIFWTQIVSIVTFLSTLFYLYRVMVEQKEATIQLQKENIAFLKDQLTEAKSQSPDVLAQSLASRVRLFEEELKRLKRDKSFTDEQVKTKEEELNLAREEAEELTKKVMHARELLSDYLCPYCDAPLAQRSCQYTCVEDNYGREHDVEHEYKVFECGYELMDGTDTGPCKTYLAKVMLECSEHTTPIEDVAK